jgi:RNA polymerase sigma-70 factor (ECF subfamily)
VTPPDNDTTFDTALRHARARVVASLTGSLGAEHLELVEDAVQDALVSALRVWTESGPPRDLASWLYRAARNRVTDMFRRERRSSSLDDEMLASADHAWADPRVADDELRLLFMCCHPALPPTARVALALSVVGGLTAPEIARALLMTEPATRQVLVRAKRILRTDGVELTLPGTRDLELRLDAVLSTLYLMFNEGYSAFTGPNLVRPELCHEAMRLCGLLLDSPLTGQPQAYALGALFFFQAARLDARSDRDGNPLRLAEQDRSTWDWHLIAVAFSLLEKAAAGKSVSTYHIEAEIASHHARAGSVDSTDWHAIVSAYDALLALNPSPIVRLNRAVAIAQRDGVEAALSELEPLESIPALTAYPFFHTTRGHLLSQAGHHGQARAAFTRALSLATSEPAHRFVEARLGLDSVSKNGSLERL